MLEDESVARPDVAAAARLVEARRAHARLEPGSINVTRTFRRLGNVTGAEAEAIQEEVVAGLSGIAWIGGAALILVMVLVIGSRRLGTKGAVPAMT